MNFFKKAFMSVMIFVAGTGTLLAADAAGSNDAAVAVGAIAVIVGLLAAVVAFVVALVMIISMWKIFVKAGQPGWAAIIPIYNLIVMWQVSRQPVWVLILCFIPFLNVIGTIMMFLGMAESFGKSAGFGIGLWLVPIIFFPILAFGSAQYQ